MATVTDLLSEISPPLICSHATPFFLIDRAKITRNLQRFVECFPGAVIHYAMKANSEPEVLRTVAAAGGGFEVASMQELAMLENLNVPPERIIYGSAIKPAEHIRAFAAYGVDRFVFDSAAELEKIAATVPGARVFVRATADDADSVFRFSEKFGAGQAEIAPLLRQAKARGLRPHGLSFHVGSQARNPMAWARALRDLYDSITQLQESGILLEAINIGGGFPFQYDNGSVSPLKQIGQNTMEEIKAMPYRMQLIAEPGRAVVANAGVLVTSVIARVERRGTTWLFLDAGVYTGLFEAMACQGSTRYPVTNMRRSDDGPQTPYALAGPTGDGLDVICRDVLLPQATDVGDRLVVHNAGAYTLCLTCTFNGFPRPAVYYT